MTKSVALIYFFVFISHFSILAIENPRAGARALALSDAYISFSDVWGTFHNQAGLALSESVSAALFYQSKFRIKELSQMAGTVIVPVNSAAFALAYSQFGTAQFKETKIGLAFSKQLSKKISAGIQLDYFSSVLPENKRAKGFVTFEGGIIYNISENLTFGAHIFNPVKSGFETNTGKIKTPIIVRTGANLQLSDYLLICFELEQNSTKNLVVKSGAEFVPFDHFAIRFGVSTKPFAYTAGIGYRIGNISTDIGLNYHGNLGISPSVSIQYIIK
jgi:hypothetical protein